LVVPILFLILFGIVDFGTIYANIIGVRQGVGTTAREAAVGQFGSASCTLTPSTLSGDDKYLMCLAHSQDGLSNDATSRVDIVVGNTSSSSYAVGSEVTICEEYALSSASGFLSLLLNGDVATAATTVEVATVNSSGLTSASETALAGSSWSFCATPAPA
jgi:Flp pilus assembly protein TadG